MSLDMYKTFAPISNNFDLRPVLGVFSNLHITPQACTCIEGYVVVLENTSMIVQ